jgi:hypothetical protein
VGVPGTAVLQVTATSKHCLINAFDGELLIKKVKLSP